LPQAIRPPLLRLFTAMAYSLVSVDCLVLPSPQWSVEERPSPINSTNEHWPCPGVFHWHTGDVHLSKQCDVMGANLVLATLWCRETVDEL